MKYFIHIAVFLILSASFGGGALAATGGSGDLGKTGGSGQAQTVTLENPIKAKSITAFFEAIIDIMLVFAIPVVVFFIILAGFKYVTARGSESTISEAHKALLYALIGGVLILGAKVLITVISGTVDAIKS